MKFNESSIFNMQRDRQVRFPVQALVDETKLTVRPASLRDMSKLQAMHRRVSAASLQARYLRPHTPTIDEIEHLCRMGDPEGLTLVASIREPEERIIGYACYVIEQDKQPVAAEPAILVEDDFQRQGIGLKLAQGLYRHALEQGVQVFDLFIHPANEGIMKLISGSGLPFQSRYAYGTREVRVWLDPDAGQ